MAALFSASRFSKKSIIILTSGVISMSSFSDIAGANALGLLMGAGNSSFVPATGDLSNLDGDCDLLPA